MLAALASLACGLLSNVQPSLETLAACCAECMIAASLQAGSTVLFVACVAVHVHIAMLCCCCIALCCALSEWHQAQHLQDDQAGGHMLCIQHI
jgi:hypothetical protein